MAHSQNVNHSDEVEQNVALEAIRKKLVGKKLSYQEIFALMDQIAKQRLGNVLTTYFAASGYSQGFTNQELFYLTRAMVETGQRLHFKGIVADKHSIGGVAGTRTTLIVVPIVAAADFTIPKSSSRAITTPGGTADDMEVLSRVEFTENEIYKIVEKTHGCIVWGGSFHIAPADDIIIKVEAPLLLESYDKILVSIMAKKVAFGSNHVVIDLPYGKSVKVHRLKDVEILKEKFEYLAKKFDIRIRCLIHRIDQPAGRGIGPILECRESLRVLQQKTNRPLDLELRSLHLAGNLIDICLKDSSEHRQKEVKEKYGNAFGFATHLLKSGKAFEKMQEIIIAQGGIANVDSERLKPGKYHIAITSAKNGEVVEIMNKDVTVIAKILGAPTQKGSGIYLNKKMNEKVVKGDILYTLYSESAHNLKEAKETLINFPILKLQN